MCAHNHWMCLGKEKKSKNQHFYLFFLDFSSFKDWKACVKPLKWVNGEGTKVELWSRVRGKKFVRKWEWRFWIQVCVLKCMHALVLSRPLIKHTFSMYRCRLPLPPTPGGSCGEQGVWKEDVQQKMKRGRGWRGWGGRGPGLGAIWLNWT